jgi:hypothetical protein
VTRTPRRWARFLGGEFAAPIALLLMAPSARAQDLAPPSTGTPTDTSNPGAAAPPPEEAKLDKEEKKDSKRGLEWVYLNADAGFSYISMNSLSSSTLSVQNTSSQGPTFGVAAGIRLFILTLGVRANLNTLSSFNLWQMDAELGFHIPIGHWEPYFGLHGGYCFVGSLADGVSGSPNVTINGGDAGLQLGLDYYFNHFVSLGLDVSGNLLFLTGTAQVPAALASAVPASGDSIGFGIAPSLHLGFHL